MNIEKEVYRNALVLKLSGDLIGESVGSAVLESVNHAIGEGLSSAILDLGEIRYMNSSGIGVLITVHSKMKKIGGEVILVNPNEQIKKVLELTKLAQVFQVVNNIDQAKEKL